MLIVVLGKDLSIDVSITNADRYQQSQGDFFSRRTVTESLGTDKIQFQTFLKKKIKFWSFHAIVLVKTFPLMYQLLM